MKGREGVREKVDCELIWDYWSYKLMENVISLPGSINGKSICFNETGNCTSMPFMLF